MHDQSLSDLLGELFPSERDARDVVDQLGLAPAEIDFGGSIRNVWNSVLRRARLRPGGLDALADYCKARYPNYARAVDAARRSYPEPPGAVADGPGRGARVRVPPFHHSSVVPPDHFIDRELELERARELIATRQSFLIVGPRRAGKTSFGQKLTKSTILGQGADRLPILGTYLDLQQYAKLKNEDFLGYTLLNTIGQVARKGFSCKYTTLSRRNPYDLHPELSRDAAFVDLLDLYREVVERTHTRGKRRPSELTSDDFEHFIADLIEIVRLKGWGDIYIFYDEANRLPVDLELDFLTWNVEALNRAGIVSIYSANPEMVEKFNPWTGREIRIGPFLDLDDLLGLLAKYCFGDVRHKDGLPMDHEAILRIWELSMGIPHRIQLLSARSFTLANEAGAWKVEEAHVMKARDDLALQLPDMFAARSR